MATLIHCNHLPQIGFCLTFNCAQVKFFLLLHHAFGLLIDDFQIGSPEFRRMLQRVHDVFFQQFDLGFQNPVRVEKLLVFLFMVHALFRYFRNGAPKYPET